MNTYVYEYKKALYFNLTNKCSNNCEFCVRNHQTDLEDKKLWINKEPSFEDVINQLPNNLSNYDEFVFCGYGEPTYRLDLVKSLSEYLSKFNKQIRINTNGHGNKINNKSIVDDLKFVDVISVSLNAPTSKEYQKICHCIFDDAFEILLNFVLECKSKNKKVVLSIVDTISKEQIEQCKLLSKALGVPLRIRNYY